MKGKRSYKKKPKPLDDTQQVIEKIGKRIREIRKEKGYTSHETFAYDFEIPRASMGRFERGDNMRISSLHTVLKALNVTFEEFFEGM
jgi:transcriptional regulator with XRE-family HTH domain